MALITGSANSEVAKVVKQGSAEFNFYIGRNIILFGYHIHHFYFGILLMGLAGWFSITGITKVSREKLALIYGSGLGLLMDEIGLLLTWGDYYSSLTYLLSIFLFGTFFNIIFFPDFWKKVRRDVISKSKTFFWYPFLNVIFKLANVVSIITSKKKNLVIICLMFLLVYIFLVFDIFYFLK